ncbi:sarcosine oxidase subunit gamma [Falsirhodobacter algicola]|uniref:Sarcosine oxidase subunit gamma n=1 Tax=Falsirhodobacter algicola TaxID=2692330 RepID=A0A8J8MVL8_9RHOB|nr:sarcosine oxidase subunit gamma [Falsirhodobacter algicola]QUS37148.1 sarcosine oxidase subunit gamma [Falsirhodobacter algicola]
MTDLSPMTALGAATARVEVFGPLTVAEETGLGLASLALRRGGAAPAGLPLPGPGGWQAGETYCAFWTGPDQWMIEAPGRAEADIAAEVKRAAPAASVTEQTDAWAVFEITSAAGGGPIRALLSKLVNVDVQTLESGAATRTGLEHMSVFVIRRAEDRLAVLGMRSAAGTIWHALAAAAARIEGN